MLFHGALFQRSFFQVVTDHKRDTFHIIAAIDLSKERKKKAAALVRLVSEESE